MLLITLTHHQRTYIRWPWKRSVDFLSFQGGLTTCKTKRKSFHPTITLPGIALIKENMKRIILSLVVASCAVAASAQPERHTFSLIPHVGAAITNISNETFYYARTSTTGSTGKYREGLAAGVDLQYQATDILAYSIGIGYTRQGCKYKDSDLSQAEPGNYTGFSNVRTNLDYLNVPLMGHIYIAQGLSLNAGVQAGFLLRSNISYDMAEITINKDGKPTPTTTKHST